MRWPTPSGCASSSRTAAVPARHAPIPKTESRIAGRPRPTAEWVSQDPIQRIRSLMGFQSLIDWLLPKDDKFFTLLEQHAEVLGEAAMVMASFPENGGSAQEALEKIHQIEHRGDDLVRAVTIALDETFVTPIDREDLH